MNKDVEKFVKDNGFEIFYQNYNYWNNITYFKTNDNIEICTCETNNIDNGGIACVDKSLKRIKREICNIRYLKTMASKMATIKGFTYNCDNDIDIITTFARDNKIEDTIAIDIYFKMKEDQGL